MWNGIALLLLAATFLPPFLVALWWPGRTPRFFIVLLIVILNAWLMLIGGSFFSSAAHDADVYEQLNMGINVPQAVSADDGVYLHALAFVFGWTLPVAGAGIGHAFYWRRTRHNARRGFPVEPLEKPNMPSEDGGN